MVTEDQALEAIDWIDRYAERYAAAQSTYTRCSETIKVVKAANLGLEGTQQERERRALTSAPYREAIEELEKADYERHLTRLKLEKQKMVFEFWRTHSANRR